MTHYSYNVTAVTWIFTSSFVSGVKCSCFAHCKDNKKILSLIALQRLRLNNYKIKKGECIKHLHIMKWHTIHTIWLLLLEFPYLTLLLELKANVHLIANPRSIYRCWYHIGGFVHTTTRYTKRWVHNTFAYHEMTHKSCNLTDVA